MKKTLICLGLVGLIAFRMGIPNRKKQNFCYPMQIDQFGMVSIK